MTTTTLNSYLFMTELHKTIIAARFGGRRPGAVAIQECLAVILKMKKRGAMKALSETVAVRLFILYVMLIPLSYGCGGALSEKRLHDERHAISDQEFVATIKQQVDDQVTYQDAVDDIEMVRGKVVKWSGDLIITWNDKLLIACPRREGGWNHFVLLLDHPLPAESTIEDLVQTVSKGHAVHALGVIIDLRTIVLDTGSDLTVPHLQAYLISKGNDREFANPVWVSHEM